MVVTLDFICLRLNPETGAPEVMLQKRKKDPEQGRFALVGGWIWEEPEESGGPYDEDLDDAQTRIIASKVGFMPSYLEQVPCEGGVSETRRWVGQ